MLRAYSQLIRLDKPIGSLLLLWPTWWGLWLAYGGVPPFKIGLVFSLGVFLTRSAGCAINDYADRHFDPLVQRTAGRPLARGSISPRSALVVSGGFTLAAFALACWGLKPQTLMWSIPAVIILVTYPYFKRFFPLPQLYLGLAFSFGIPMAFIESRALLPPLAWLLVIANCFWVVAYDTIYALLDIADDRKLGLKTSALTFGKWVMPIIMACYAGFSGLLVAVGISSHLQWPFFGGLLLACALIGHIYRLIAQQHYFKAFRYNNHVGGLILVAIAASYWI